VGDFEPRGPRRRCLLAPAPRVTSESTRSRCRASNYRSLQRAIMAVWHPFGFSTAARRAPPPLPQVPQVLSVPQVLGSAPESTSDAGATGAGAASAVAATTAVAVAATLHCDPCDKEFPNERALQQHLKSHVVCTQCAFQATQSIVLEHSSTAHSTGARWAYVSRPQRALKRALALGLLCAHCYCFF
jgi:hypothetical protein